MWLYKAELVVVGTLLAAAVLASLMGATDDQERSGQMALISLAFVVTELLFVAPKAWNDRLFQILIHLCLMVAFLALAVTFIMEKCPYGSGCAGSAEIPAFVFEATILFFALGVVAALIPLLGLVRRDHMSWQE